MLKIWRRVEYKMPGRREPYKVEWLYERDSTESNVEEWLAMLRRFEPEAVFVASSTKPKGRKGPKILKGPGFTY